MQVIALKLMVTSVLIKKIYYFCVLKDDLEHMGKKGMSICK